ncbi:MAG: hypothetical protein AAF206_10435, partial [Bacteroidota bacterium]
CLLFACQKNDFQPNSLAAFIAENEDRVLTDTLIACAAGGQVGFLDDPQTPVSIFFLPVEGASEFRYFETPDLSDWDNFEAYQSVDLALEPVFNGYLMRFKRAATGGERWGRVTYFTEGKLHICNAIRLKDAAKASEFLPQNVSIDLSQPTEPRFSWEDGQIEENAIYFQVVSDAADNLVSGTYTFDRFFQFYSLDNVVLNIRDVNPPPMLAEGNDYTFTLMGVSEDNWVNLIGQKVFKAQ